MNTLLEKLEKADQICAEANQHFEKAAAVEQRKEYFLSKTKGAPKWLKFLGYLFPMEICYYLINALIALIFGVSFEMIGKKTFGFVVILAVIVAMYLVEKKLLTGFINKQLSKYDDEIAVYNRDAEQVFEENAQYLEFLPVEYWYPLATEYLIKIVKSGRCSTLSEALDKFDQQLHRWKVENANAEILATQQLQIANLESIKHSSRVNAAANIFNAFINIDRSL